MVVRTDRNSVHSHVADVPSAVVTADGTIRIIIVSTCCGRLRRGRLPMSAGGLASVMRDLLPTLPPSKTTLETNMRMLLSKSRGHFGLQVRV